jgi:hypothetical protein
MKEDDVIHPAAPSLDALAAGDDVVTAAAHVARCEACAAYVAKLRAEAEAFRGAREADAFAKAIARRAEWKSELRTAETRARAVWIAAPLLLAAALLLWIRPPSVPIVPSTLPSGSVSASDDLARFKGGISVAVVRDRNGQQDRLLGPFEVEPLDRIRVEIALDHEQAITAGLLAADGGWVPLLAPVSLPAGTHYSDLAARFDDSPEDAVLLVGAPASVDRARGTRNFEGVVAWRVRSAPKR